MVAYLSAQCFNYVFTNVLSPCFVTIKRVVVTKCRWICIRYVSGRTAMCTTLPTGLHHYSEGARRAAMHATNP
eukprot:6491458-Amphidinium_carterae.6